MLESSVPERGSKKPKKEPVTETQEEATGFLGGLLSSVKEKFSSEKASSSKPAAAKARAVFSSPQGAAKSVAAPSQKLAKAGTDGATSRGASPVPSMASMLRHSTTHGALGCLPTSVGPVRLMVD